MEKRRHYWNGRWGRLARHDILIFEDAGRWQVESRIGGAEGRVTYFDCADETAVDTRVAALMADMTGWREL